MKQDKLYFVGQKAFIEKDGKTLVVFDQLNKIDFPGGKIQEGEYDLAASFGREVKEETGLDDGSGHFHALEKYFAKI